MKVLQPNQEFACAFSRRAKGSGLVRVNQISGAKLRVQETDLLVAGQALYGKNIFKFEYFNNLNMVGIDFIQLVVRSFASKGASKMLRATGHARMVRIDYLNQLVLNAAHSVSLQKTWEGNS